MWKVHLLDGQASPAQLSCIVILQIFQVHPSIGAGADLSSWFGYRKLQIYSAFPHELDRHFHYHVDSVLYPVGARW